MAPEPRFLSKKSAPAPCRESFPTRMSPERTDETLFRPLRRPELCAANMEHKRVTLFAGHYGSGKTNIAVNYALYLRSLGKKVAVADLDIVNPYFRTKDSQDDLEAAGIRLVSPQFANSNVDLPALPAEAYGLVEDRSEYAILDIGGDDRGAYALGRYVPFLEEENDYQMAFVANPYRPLTATPQEALEVMREIEEAGHLPFTAIVNNANLGPETTAETVLRALPYMEELSRISGLPVWMTTAEETVAAGLRGKVEHLLPMRLQKKYFDLPEQRRAPPPRPLFG